MPAILTPHFHMPPRTHTAAQRLRAAGFEIELSGLALDEIADTIVELFGGEARTVSRFEQRVVESPYGSFRVEVDSTILRDAKYRELLEGLGLHQEASRFAHAVYEQLERLLEGVAAHLIPYEVVTPPIPFDRLHEVEDLRRALHRRRAEGTHASLLYAFGLHLNPEVPAVDCALLLDHLRAFLLLYDWLVEAGDIDVSRWISPFIEDFGEPFRRKVLAPDYPADPQRFVSDYLSANPTRNRPLDLLPVLATEHRALVCAAMADPELLSARPAFHYRLPNCQIDEPDWTIAGEWNRWVLVERLAADAEALRDLARTYLGLRPQALDLQRQLWLDHSRRWLQASGWLGR